MQRRQQRWHHWINCTMGWSEIRGGAGGGEGEGVVHKLSDHKRSMSIIDQIIDRVCDCWPEILIWVCNAVHTYRLSALDWWRRTVVTYRPNIWWKISIRTKTLWSLFSQEWLGEHKSIVNSSKLQVETNGVLAGDDHEWLWRVTSHTVCLQQWAVWS